MIFFIARKKVEKSLAKSRAIIFFSVVNGMILSLPKYLNLLQIISIKRNYFCKKIFKNISRSNEGQMLQAYTCAQIFAHVNVHV